MRDIVAADRSGAGAGPGGAGPDGGGPVQRLVVGRIGRPQGVRGEVTVEVRTDDPDLRFAPGAVLLTDPPQRGPLTVADGRVQSGRLVVSFVGVEDRNTAETLRNTMLVVDVGPDETPEDPEEFYDHQLVGLRVERTDGSAVGVVADVLHLPAQDVLVVRPTDAAESGGPEALVPFVRDIVPVVEPGAGRVVVDPPEGLIDFDTDASAAPADDDQG